MKFVALMFFSFRPSLIRFLHKTSQKAALGRQEVSVKLYEILC